MENFEERRRQTLWRLRRRSLRTGLLALVDRLEIVGVALTPAEIERHATALRLVEVPAGHTLAARTFGARQSARV